MTLPSVPLPSPTEPVEQVEALRESVGAHLEAISSAVAAIRASLVDAAPGRILKGGEWVGWLGEVYIALLYAGEVEPSDTFPYDVRLPDGRTVSVKTRRRGQGSNWRESGTISCARGGTDPHQFDFLGFVLLDPQGHLEGIWMLPWDYLLAGDRLKPSRPNNVFRGYQFSLRNYDDEPCRVWPLPTKNADD